MSRELTESKGYGLEIEIFVVIVRRVPRELRLERMGIIMSSAEGLRDYENACLARKEFEYTTVDDSEVRSLIHGEMKLTSCRHHIPGNPNN
jgi:hypothetical protein